MFMIYLHYDDDYKREDGKCFQFSFTIKILEQSFYLFGTSCKTIYKTFDENYDVKSIDFVWAICKMIVIKRIIPNTYSCNF